MQYKLQSFAWRMMIVTIMTSCFAWSHSRAQAGQETGFPPAQTRVPGQYLVTLVPGTGATAISDLYGEFGIKGIKELAQNIFLVILRQDPGPEKMEELRKRDPRVKSVQPDFVYQLDGFGNSR